MAALYVRLFGGFSLECEERHCYSFLSRKAQDLFCYLLLYRHRAHTRETLAGTLWGDTTVSLSRARLRKALWQLRSELNAFAPTFPWPIHAENDRLTITIDSNLWLDVAEFDQAFQKIANTPVAQLELSEAQHLSTMVDLYKGGLLDGNYQDWCLYERERLQTIYQSLLDKLINYCQIQGAYEQGLIYGARSLRIDRAREHTHRCIMLLYAQSGDRTAALRQYERCCEILHEELQAEPSEYTVELYKQIRANHVTPSMVLDGSPVAIQGIVSTVLSRLRLAEATVSSLQQALIDDIKTIEDFLRQ